MDIFIFCIVSYLVGSISFAMIIGRVFFKKDLSKEGSGNLGTTNTFRILGKKAGFVVALGDIGKGFLPTFYAISSGIDIHPLIPGIFAILGHVYPIFFNFKGGKAVATTSGILLAFSPISFAILFCLFFVSLCLTKIVSLSSIVTAIGLVVISLWNDDSLFFPFCLLIASFVVFKHKSNIKRIIKKDEPKIKWM